MNVDFKLDFILLGFARAGTSWIYKLLKEHPEICVPNRDELYFFCKDPLWGSFSNNFRGIKWLEKMFSHAGPGQIKGERTTLYISSPEAPDLIKQTFPNTKFIISYRNPADRLYSFYYMLKRIYPIYETIEEFIDRYPEYVETGYYYTLTKRYLDIFPKENFHFIIFDDIVNNPEKTAKELYSFLGADGSFIPSNLYSKVNEGKIPSSLLLRDIIGRIVLYLKKRKWGTKIYQTANLMNFYGSVRWLSFKNLNRSQIPELNPDTRKKIIEMYKEETDKLSKLIDKNLDFWMK